MHTHLTFAIRLFEFSFSVAETRTTLIGSMSCGTIVKKTKQLCLKVAVNTWRRIVVVINMFIMLR